MNILNINNKKERQMLRTKTVDFNFSKFTKKEINELLKEMRELMIKADGIGLAANQVGLNAKVFIVQIQKKDRHGNRRSLTGAEQKFYAIFNPKIVKFSAEKKIEEEGCLSVPETFGLVERPEKIKLIGFDKNGKPIKIKAWGLLARVFQHEIDHLNGILFTDKAKNIKKLDTHRNS